MKFPSQIFIRRPPFVFTVLAFAVSALIALTWTSRATTQSSQVWIKQDEPRAHFVPGEVLVRFRSEALAEKNVRQTKSLNVQSRDIPMQIIETDASSLLEGLRLVHVEPADTMAAVEALNSNPDVLYAEPNYVRELFRKPNDTFYANLWGLKNTGNFLNQNAFFPAGFDIRAEKAWDITTGSRDVVVGIVDGGIFTNHPDLQPNIWTNPGEIAGNGVDDDGNELIDDVNGFDFFHNRGNFLDPGSPDSENHATHVAGIVGAAGNNGMGVVGVNWQVSLMSLKIFGRTGERPAASNVQLLVRAFAYAKKMRDLWTSTGGVKGANIRVLNNSYGGYGWSHAERDAIRALNESSILFVAASGNYGRDNDIFPAYPAGYDSPNIISVASTGFDSDTLSSFSNLGTRSVTLSAPGQTIQSTISSGDYANFTGTSMSSAYVTGAAALVCAAYPNITVGGLRAAIIFNGDRVPSQDYKTLTARRLNAFASLNAAAENDSTPPSGIPNFQIIAQNERKVTLGWTAPGDDGSHGTVSLYDIRFAENDVSSSQQFEAATPISSRAVPFPEVAGSLQSASVEVPFGHTTGFIALRAIDNLGHTSPLAVAPVTVSPSAADPYQVVESAPQALSTGGTKLDLFGVGQPDEGYRRHQLPFAFPFFGSWTSTAYISLNGAVYFSKPPDFVLPPYTSNGIPLDTYSSIRALHTNNMIAPMWDDLIASGGVYAVSPDPDRFIIRWEGTTYDTKFDDGTSRGQMPVKFEMEIRRDGTIQFRYGDGNERLFPVVGISGGSPDAYVVGSHTSENVFKNLTNANTVTFSPRLTPVPPSADMQVVLIEPSSGGNIPSPIPQAVAPGQTVQFIVHLKDLGPDAAENVVVTSQLPPGLSFVECGLNVTCTGPPPGSDGGTVTVNVGAMGQSNLNALMGASFYARVTAAAGITLATTLSVSSSTPDPNPGNNTVTRTLLVANYGPFGDVVSVDGPLALKQDGTVWYWGYPFGSVECVEGCFLTIPQQQPGLSNVIAISRGIRHALALKADGSVWSWGSNEYGQLGNQPVNENPFLPYPPMQISSLKNIRSIYAALSTSYAVEADGTVWAWGFNDYGQIGDGTRMHRSTPTRVTAISQVRSMSATNQTAYALKEDGTVWSWGDNVFGMLGNGTSVSLSLTPVQVAGLSNVTQVATRFIHTVALKSDGSVWVWGRVPTVNDSSNEYRVPTLVNNFSNVAEVSAGDSVFLARKTDGTVWTWGFGQTIAPIQVPGLTGIKKINAYDRGQMTAITADNKLLIWGFGFGPSPAYMNSFPVVERPVFSPGGNLYVFPRNVRIDCATAGAVIHYTTNGAEPTESDPALNRGDSVRIAGNLVLKAKAWRSGLSPSETTTASYTILVPSDPPPTTIQFASAYYTVNEGFGLATITVTRAGDISAPASVKYATSDATDVNFVCNPATVGQVTGKASRKCDYHIAAGRVRFAPGETSKQIVVSVINDVYVEGDEAFTLTLSNPTGATLGGQDTTAITITDNFNEAVVNPIDMTRFYVELLYVDLLSRQPDQAGYLGWIDRIDKCGQPGQAPPPCDRVTVGGDGFLRSAEFFDREFFVIRLYRTALGRILRYDDVGDLAFVSGFLTDADLDLNKQEVVSDIMSRPEFGNIYNGLNNTQYVDTLIQTAAVTLPAGVRDNWVTGLDGSTKTRAQVFRELSERSEVSARYLHEAQVVSCYYGFFTRNPDGAYLNFLDHLDRGEINLGDLANAFINATEYRQRFGP